MGKPKKNLEKKVKDWVKDELQEELEEKHALIGKDTRIIPSPSIPSGNVSVNENFMRIFPDIFQGPGQYNNRIGNEIRLKHVDISMLLAWNRAVDLNPDSLDYSDSALGIRVMILKQKDNEASAGALNNFQGDKLLENGNLITPQPSDFNGRTINLFQKINREQFAVRYDKVHYMERGLVINPSGVSNYVVSKAPRPTYFKHRLKFGKRGLKLTFGNAGSVQPSNFPYFMVIGYVSTLQSAAPSNSLLNYSYSANAQFTDA